MKTKYVHICIYDGINNETKTEYAWMYKWNGNRVEYIYILNSVQTK